MNTNLKMISTSLKLGAPRAIHSASKMDSKNLNLLLLLNLNIKKMKIFKYALLAIPFLYFSCSDDDDNSIPEPVNEEEVITTMTITLVASDQSGVVVLQTQDLDGDGGEEPVVTVSGSISNMTSYIGSIQWLNEMEDEPEDITEEVLEEADEHQVFFGIGEGLPIQVVYADEDSNGYPVGVNFILAPTEAGVTGSGPLTVTLIHEPTKPNDGLDSAGGSIDIQTTFDLVVE
jgi:hypothetical protein